ncbi:hypothetical protein C8F01DRAFT_994999 [Mycena amicta]|nr:hypothetical protein C8F01DRAFT_994999 [Mycena amicta]
MPSFSTVKASNEAYSPPTPPVVLVFGGTSGIGKATAEAFARYTNGNARIIIVGRNKAAAEGILASFPKPKDEDGGWKHEFVACDTSLMKNVAGVTHQLLETLPKINFLCICSGHMSLLGRKDTVEGIDEAMAVRYYSRWKIMHDLLPLLRRTAEAGEPARVLNVLDPTHGIAIEDTDDFGLKKPGRYSGFKATQVTLTYTDLAMEEFALREPSVAFTHIHPGFVNTNVFNSKHWAMRLAAPIIKPAIWAFAMAPAVCAENMVYALLNAKKGYSRMGEKVDDMGMKSHPYQEEKARAELRQKLWEHTEKEVTVA